MTEIAQDESLAARRAKRRRTGVAADLQRFFGRTRLNQIINISLKHKYVYFLVPKVASRTLLATFQKVELKALPHAKEIVHPTARESAMVKPYQLGFDQLEEILTGGEFFKFCIVRNPYARVISAFRNKIVGGAPEKKLILRALGLPIEDLKQPVSMDEFVRVICATPERRMNLHWMPQHLVSCATTVRMDFIGHMEQFSKDLRIVARRTGTKLPNDLVDYRPHATGTTPADAATLTQEQRAMLRDKFAKDFELFGYEP